VNSVSEDTLRTVSQNSWNDSNFENYVYSVVFNVTLEDSELQGVVTLGFFVEDEDPSKLCLAYIDEEYNFWICQTDNFTWVNNSFLQATTTHFTAFSIVILPTNGPPGSKTENQYEGGPNLPLPLPDFIGLCVGILCATVIIATVIGMIYKRRRDKLREQQMRKLQQRGYPVEMYDSF